METYFCIGAIICAIRALELVFFGKNTDASMSRLMPSMDKRARDRQVIISTIFIVPLWPLFILFYGFVTLVKLKKFIKH